MPLGRSDVAQGEKTKYTDKQKRKAAAIEEGYEKRGVPQKEAEARAWATVNKQDGGGKNPGGSGRAVEDRSAAAKKGWETRRKKAASK